DSNDPVWRKEPSLFFYGECKNWSAPVEWKDVSPLVDKIEGSFKRCRLGFFIAVGGFTAGTRSHVRDRRREDLLIVLLDAADVEALVDAKDRNAELKRLHSRAVTGEKE